MGMLLQKQIWFNLILVFDDLRIWEDRCNIFYSSYKQIPYKKILNIFVQKQNRSSYQPHALKVLPFPEHMILCCACGIFKYKFWVFFSYDMIDTKSGWLSIVRKPFKLLTNETFLKARLQNNPEYKQ